MGEDIDSLFITGGLAAKETKTSHQPEENALNDYLSKGNVLPHLRDRVPALTESTCFCCIRKVIKFQHCGMKAR